MTKESKYRNRKVVNALGKFDSILEYERYLFLLDAQRDGSIKDLKRQVKYELIPKQTRTKTVVLKTKTKTEQELLEMPCCYKADFTYSKLSDGGWETVVEDTKGGGGLSHGHFTTQTPEFVIKRKLMLYLYGVKIRIVTKSTELI